MSKIGIVRDGAISVNKPVKLEFINKVETSPTLIKLTYNVGVPSSINIDSNIVILLANPEPLTYTGELIRKIVLRWIGEGLASSSVLTLNDYLGDLVVVQVGVVGSQTTGNIIAAADSTAASNAAKSAGRPKGGLDKKLKSSIQPAAAWSSSAPMLRRTAVGWAA